MINLELYIRQHYIALVNAAASDEQEFHALFCCGIASLAGICTRVDRAKGIAHIEKAIHSGYPATAGELAEACRLLGASRDDDDTVPKAVALTALGRLRPADEGINDDAVRGLRDVLAAVRQQLAKTPAPSPNERSEAHEPESDKARASSAPGAVEIFTDGACSGNPGPGGWAALLRRGEDEEFLSGASPATTNNEMELLAAIEALENLPPGATVALTTDSQYVERGITEWIGRWKRNGWRTRNGPVKNRALWERLDTARLRHDVTFWWVRGHDGHRDNERVDSLAREMASKAKNSC